MGALGWYVAVLFALDVLIYLARGVVKFSKGGKGEANPGPVGK